MTIFDTLDFKAMFYTAPEGAKIIIDGKNTGRLTPALIDGLSPETHNFELLYDGYEYLTGTFNPVGWRGFTAQINRILVKRKKPIYAKSIPRVPSFKIKHNEYDPLNSFTWKICPACGIKFSEIPFKYRKHQCKCRNCGEVFKVVRGNRFKHPLNPCKDPDSLIFSNRLHEITGKEPSSFIRLGVKG